MTTLEDRLHALGHLLDDDYGPITADELAEPVRASDLRVGTTGEGHAHDLTGLDLRRNDELRQTADDARPTSRKRLVVLVAAAALLLVVGVVVSDGDSGNVVTGAASSPAADVAPPTAGIDVREPAAPAPDAAVWTSVDGITWSRVPGEEAARGRMFSVTVGGPGLVAVGSAEDLDDAAVWTSVDGICWFQVPHDDAVFGGPDDQWMSDVTTGGPGLVAVGFDGCHACGEEPYDESDAAVWTSGDGLAWSRVPHDEALFGGAEMTSVMAAGPGLVAVGQAVSGSDTDAAVWTSVDGIVWSRIPHDEEVFGGPDNQTMNDITVGGPGLVAVGRDGAALWEYSGDQVAAVWTSVDGITWSRVPRDPAVFGERQQTDRVMLGVTIGGPGLVAVGWDASDNKDATVWSPDAAVWTSVDGITWTRAPHDEDVFGGMTSWAMLNVTAGGPGLVAVGETIWTSTDGITWSRAPERDAKLGDQSLSGITVAGPGLVAVG
jgi:hypothetical protein